MTYVATPPLTIIPLDEEVPTRSLKQKGGGLQSRMASSCNPCHFLIPRFFVHMLALVLTVQNVFSTTETLSQLQGEVGGNVTFHCPVIKQKGVEFVYLQRGNSFLNGYNTKVPGSFSTWNNTRMDPNKSAVLMDRLNISHRGVYTCHVKYRDSQEIFTSTITLTVTAKYSIPSVKKSCSDENYPRSCEVTCKAHDGYPHAKMLWTTVGNISSQMWEILNSEETSNPSTMLFASSSTALFNCSDGQINFTCSVGNITSAVFSVCDRKEAPQHNTPLVITAAVCVLVVVVVIFVVLCRRRLTGAAAAGERLERVNSNEEEAIALSEKHFGKEAA